MWSSEASLVCAHCGLPVPGGLVDPAAERQFCCNGCRTVYEMIHGCGLDRFYRLRAEVDVKASPARTTPRKYDDFDSPVFHGLYCQAGPDGEQAVELYLEGVHCAACVWLVEKLPHVLPGVLEARLDLRRSLVRVRWEGPRIALSKIARTLDSLGYPPHPAKDARSRELRREEDRRFLIRLGVAGACAGNVMTLAFALYGGDFSGIEAQYSNFFRIASMCFGLVALAWPGAIFFRGAWAAIRTRTAHLDLPIALGLAAGGAAGAVNALLGRGEIYFDSLTMLVFLLLVGRWLQRRQQCWANDALELLFSLTPASARRLEGEQVVETPVEAIQPGDRVEVRSGESIPVDGAVSEGRSAVDQALLTGESRPAAVGPGDPVHAGTVNLGARLVVCVRAVGAETRVGKLMQLVERHSRDRAPIVQLADRMAGYFLVAVLGLAAATMALWLARDPSQAIDHTVTLLIVACPCALGLATPLAMTVALGRAAKRRILIKGGDALEALSGRGVIFLDKTGTLTAGRMSLVAWEGDPGARGLAAALERQSAHPLAQALAAAEPDVDLLVADVRQTLGGGIEGTVDGRRVLVGSARFVAAAGATSDDVCRQAERRIVEAGATPVLVAVDGECRAVAGVGDPLRDDVVHSLAALARLGWQTRILSGDHPDLVAAVGRRLGLAASAAVGGVLPEGKVEMVRAAAEQGPVVMVGDGVNDAAALAAATVGIAVHGGAEASLAAAQIYLDRPGLTPIVELVAASRSTMRAIHRCIAVSVAYNVAAGALAVAGLIGPLTAAILMPINSFTVLGLAYAARTFRKQP